MTIGNGMFGGPVPHLSIAAQLPRTGPASGLMYNFASGSARGPGPLHSDVRPAKRETLIEADLLAALEADRARLDYLEAMLREGGVAARATLRWSVCGRGFRLHESHGPETQATVRQAIDAGMAAQLLERRRAR
jgi:hypothetical protein